MPGMHPWRVRISDWTTGWNQNGPREPSVSAGGRTGPSLTVPRAAPAACQFNGHVHGRTSGNRRSESERMGALRAFPGGRGINMGPLDHRLVIRRHELRVLYGRMHGSQRAAISCRPGG